MKYKIEKYLLKKTDELAFITLKADGDFKIKGYDIPAEGLDVPIKNEVLVKGIKDKTAQESLNSMSIADAMIYIMGIDSTFKYNEEYDKFIETLAKGLDLDLKAYMGYMSNKYFEIGEYTDSLIYMKSLVNKYPEDVNGLYHYAIICQQIAEQYKKDEDAKAVNDFLLDALDKLERIINIDPKFGPAYYQLGYHYYNQDQYIKSKLTWEEALKLDLDDDIIAEIQDNLGKMDYKVQYEEGYTLVLSGKCEEGLEKLLPLEDEFPDWWNLLFMIALGYKGMADIENAQKYFEKILVLRPTQVDTLVEMGLLEAQKYNLEGAIEYFEKAAKLRKEDPEILCNLGMAYFNNGNMDDAAYYIERAYELDPMDEVTNACLRELNKYR